MEETKVMPVSDMQAGQEGTVVALTGDYDARQRLLSMGISVGCDLKLLVRAPGRYMLAVHEARLAIGVKAAEDILVAAKEPEDVVKEAVKRLKAIWAR